MEPRLAQEVSVKNNQRTLIISAAALGFVIFLPLSMNAQSRPNPPSRNSPVPSSSDTMREMLEREMKIRKLEMDRESDKRSKVEVSKETVKQVNDDFTRIQEINVEMMRDYSEGKPPDYPHIAAAMSEIKKRASRLRTNLILPSGDDISGEHVGSASTPKHSGRSPLLDLNDLIFSFVTNPIFKNENTIDLELGARAKRDLAGIVDLSDRISRSAEKLSKTAAPKR
jgi:hypothetical protein